MSTSYSGSESEERALDLLINLQRAADSVKKRCRTFEEAGLTDSQFGTLDAVYHLGPLHQKDIGEKILKTDANMTTVIDNLEERGLVERERDPEDRRCFHVSLTEEGRDLFESLFDEHVDVVEEVAGALDADEQDTLIRLCKKLGTADSAPSDEG